MFFVGNGAKSMERVQESLLRAGDRQQVLSRRGYKHLGDN